MAFTSAAAVVIGLSQLKHLLGVSVQGSSKLHSMVVALLEAIPQVHIGTLILGLVAIACIVLLKKYAPKIPSALVVVVLGTFIVYGFDLHTTGVKIVGEIPQGLPSFKVPRVAELPFFRNCSFGGNFGFGGLYGSYFCI